MTVKKSSVEILCSAGVAETKDVAFVMSGTRPTSAVGGDELLGV